MIFKTRAGSEVVIFRMLKNDHYIYGAYIGDFNGEEVQIPVRWNKDGSFIDKENTRSLDLILG